MGTLQTSLTWFFSALRTSPKLLKKMKIVILLFAVLATINAAALQNAKAADKPAAVKAADLPKPAKVEDRLELKRIWQRPKRMRERMIMERPKRMRERILSSVFSSVYLNHHRVVLIMVDRSG